MHNSLKEPNHLIWKFLGLKSFQFFYSKVKIIIISASLIFHNCIPRSSFLFMPLTAVTWWNELHGCGWSIHQTPGAFHELNLSQFKLMCSTLDCSFLCFFGWWGTIWQLNVSWEETVLSFLLGWEFYIFNVKGYWCCWRTAEWQPAGFPWSLPLPPNWTVALPQYRPPPSPASTTPVEQPARQAASNHKNFSMMKCDELDAMRMFKEIR